jgi:GDP/UDP-N,N'-diacetylbacillosamine 2-epimerase (hydrolysing)
MKRICVVTGSRAEYGLLRWVIAGIQQSKLLELRLVVTGMHLSPEFGSTVEEIEADGFAIDHRVETLLSSDTAIGVTKSIGLGLIGFSEVLDKLKPDILMVLGDRYEIFAAAASAMIAGVPIAHVHGGEKTVGAFDEAIRHSITKMSHLHFVANIEYQRRVIQLGENPEFVFNVGGLGVDSALKSTLLSRAELEISLGIQLARKNFLITFHPETLQKGSSTVQMKQLLAALSDLRDTGLIFTMPNGDTDGRILFRLIEEFCRHHKDAHVYKSLGNQIYYSCMAHFDAVIGNSSSGLMEAPSFKKGTINIGDRQLGRLKASSVIDCNPVKEEIDAAIKKILSNSFQEALLAVKNPYGDGGASEAIVQKLERLDYERILRKDFYDI